MAELRREDDKRIDQLDRKITDVAANVASIRDMLISEPEQSPMGRALIRRSVANQGLIDDLRDDFEKFHAEEFTPIRDWWQQTRGAWRLVMGTATVLSIVATFFGVAAYLGFGK